MNLLLSILIVLASVVLILIVLVQNPKGGGLASSFSSANNILGVRKMTSTIEKMTWILVASIVVLSIVAAAFSSEVGPQRVSEISDKVENSVAQPVQQPVNFDETAPISTESAESEAAETPVAE